MTDSHDIVELVRRARIGEPEAFESLVRLFERKVVSVAYQFLGEMDTALEVGQESLVRAYQELPKLKNPDAFAAWLLRIVTNLSLSYLRSKRISVSSPLGAEGEGPECERALGTIAAAAGPRQDPARVAESSETMAALDGAIRALPEKYRAVVVLHCVEDVPHEEIARALGIPVKTVRWRLFQARQILRNRIEKYL